jgi:hypothetical protein
MKDLIRNLLKESLEEMSTQPKKEFGRGAFHKVYSSNKNPDRLYKIGDEDTVDKWVTTFQQYPQYFPKVYRVFPYRKDPSLKVVEIEKLDTAKAANELSMIESFLLDYSDEISCNGRFISPLNFFETPCFNSVVEAADNGDDPYILPILYKWAKVLRAVTPIIEKDLGRNLDLHIGNVAYDKIGKIKFIDI